MLKKSEIIPMQMPKDPSLAWSRLPTWALALVPVILWGGSFFVTKSLYADLGPITVAAGRWLIAALFFAALVVVRGETGQVGAALHSEPFTVLGFGLIGVGFLYAVQNVALTFTTITNASVLGNLVPIFVLVLSVIVLGERPRRPLVVAVLGATVGAAVLSLQGGAFDVAPAHLWGDLLSILAALAGGIYVVLGKRMVNGFSPLVVTLLAAGVGAMVLVPVALLVEGVPSMPGPTGIMGLFILGMGSSAAANLVWWMVVERMPASRAALFILLVPVVGAGMGVLFAGEPVTWPALMGGGMVLTALYIAQVSQ
jgi:drug/metabolite transporter (DMT)-like permease